ncbi:hypothetical protein BGI41_05575 [Methanobrevibacter sp. 87.7]|uniref:metal-dependent hydrolase n=1 Tax=Methanobrevibacter sp. 87.7 TaxID=387957 RepID=UPI000B50EF38|nr:metal-dependent hydrolase [Methanobrevibacter sp. 87.7]OWT32826.1 hypothetical protein BGI41_05575 [Methanobrevibacter sp. 87.7]
MSSYKLHSVFAIILGLLFFQNPLLIATCFIGANFPDNDHKLKKDNVYRLIILSLILFILLHFLKLPYYLAILVCLLGLIFYFSSHRGFTHSIFGVVILSLILYYIIIMSSNLLVLIPGFKSLNNYHILFIMIILILLSLFSLNRKLSPLFIVAMILIYISVPISKLTNISLFFSLLLGLFSHIVLDSFSPSGVKLLNPLSNKKFFKTFGSLMILLLLSLSFFKFRGILYIIFNNLIF